MELFIKILFKNLFIMLGGIGFVALGAIAMLFPFALMSEEFTREYAWTGYIIYPAMTICIAAIEAKKEIEKLNNQKPQ